VLLLFGCAGTARVEAAGTLCAGELLRIDGGAGLVVRGENGPAVLAAIAIH